MMWLLAVAKGLKVLWSILSLSSMNLPDWLQLFLLEVRNTPFLEWAGVGFGVAEVLLARVNHIALYPTGIISVLISTYIFYGSGLYAESLLNVYYLVMSVYGWYIWMRRKDHKELVITRCGPRDWAITSVIVVAGFAILYYCLSRWTNSTVPVWDAWVSATAWAGMWLLARRKLENWILLNISNVFAIPLLIYKHLPLYTLLTVFLFLVAIQGYFRWRSIMRNSLATSVHPL
jgi:nicotinamide mononucleotide transporter